MIDAMRRLEGLPSTLVLKEVLESVLKFATDKGG